MDESTIHVLLALLHLPDPQTIELELLINHFNRQRYGISEQAKSEKLVGQVGLMIRDYIFQV